MGAISGLHCQIEAFWSISAILPVMDLHGQEKRSGEADQLTLASEAVKMHSYLVYL